MVNDEHSLASADALAEDGDWAAAERLYREVAEAGEPRAWMAIGRHHCEPEHRDHPLALELFERAAAMGSDDGALQAAYMHWWGSAGEKDMARALVLFEQAAHAGGCIAATRAGWIRYTGDAGEVDTEGAVEMFQLAVDLDEEPEAMLGLGHAFSKGRIDKDLPLASRWFRRATLESETLGERATNESRRKMFSGWANEGAQGVHGLLAELRELAESGNTDAAFEVAQAIRQRFVAGEESPVPYLERAAKAAHGQACLQLGHIYRTGEGTESDPRRARDLLRRAAETGLASAHHDYAFMLHSGFGGPVDLPASLEHYRTAAESGRPNSMMDLAANLQERGADGDNEECTRWLVRASEEGHINAMFWLAKRYRDGVGVDADLVQATRWFFAPLAQGNGDGLHEIHQYVREMEAEEVIRAAELAGIGRSWAQSTIDTFLS